MPLRFTMEAMLGFAPKHGNLQFAAWPFHLGHATAAPSMTATPFTLYTVQVEPAGLQYDVEGDLTLLEAASFGRVKLPSSCRNGTCRTCMCKLVSGTVDYTIAWPGLLPEEKAEGYVLPCVARPTSNVVLDQPEACAS